MRKSLRIPKLAACRHLTNAAHSSKFAHMHNDLIGSNEAATILNVDRATFNRWVARGDIPVEVKFPGTTGARMFRRGDVERAAKDRAAAKAHRSTIQDSVAS